MANLARKNNDISPKRTTRSATRLRSRSFPKATMVSDIDDDSEVDMGKMKGRRARSSTSDAAQDGPAGAGGVRNSSRRQPTIALRHIASDGDRA